MRIRLANLGASAPEGRLAQVGVLCAVPVADGDIGGAYNATVAQAPKN